MHKLSLHHLTMLDAHPLQLVDAAHAGGFDYYGLRVVAPTAADSIVDVAHDPALIRELAARMDATGVRLLDIEAIWLQESTRIDALLPALEAGHRLGRSMCSPSVTTMTARGSSTTSARCAKRPHAST